MKTRTNQPVFLDNGQLVDDSKLGETKLYLHTIEETSNDYLWFLITTISLPIDFETIDNPTKLYNFLDENLDKIIIFKDNSGYNLVWDNATDKGFSSIGIYNGSVFAEQYYDFDCESATDTVTAL